MLVVGSGGGGGGGGGSSGGGGDCNTPTALPQPRTSVPILQNVGWAPYPVFTAPTRVGTLDRPVRSE